MYDKETLAASRDGAPSMPAGGDAAPPDPSSSIVFLRHERPERGVIASIKRLARLNPFKAAATRDRVEREREERAQQELVRRSDLLKDQIIDTLSHELRTPISVIAGFTNILQEQLAGPLTHDQREYLGQIQDEADHLLKLINDMLELGQIQAGKLLLQPRPVHLGEIVKDVLMQVAPLAQRKQQHILDEVPEDLPLVTADDARIAQVLTHLLINAIKFSPEGTTAVVRARVEGHSLRCEVEDGGMSIPEDDAPKLFQRFTQLDMSTTRRFGGVGIGLFISKALVEAHRGTIGLGRSALEGTPMALGHGNTFWFTLPLGPVQEVA